MTLSLAEQESTISNQTVWNLLELFEGTTAQLTYAERWILPNTFHPALWLRCALINKAPQEWLLLCYLKSTPNIIDCLVSQSAVIFNELSDKNYCSSKLQRWDRIAFYLMMKTIYYSRVVWHAGFMSLNQYELRISRQKANNSQSWSLNHTLCSSWQTRYTRLSLSSPLVYHDRMRTPANPTSSPY